MSSLLGHAFRRLVHARMAALLCLAFTAAEARAQEFSNGFEADTSGWDVFGGFFDAVRVPSGTNGIPSADGAWHAAGDVPATDWGGFDGSFPDEGYTTSVDVYLDVGGGYANDTQLDFTSAINDPIGDHRRDFIFNLGFYDSTDVTGPGAGTNRFVVSASNNTEFGNSFPKNPARSPVAIGTTGWYTFQHAFRDVGGVLEVELSILDADGDLVSSWVLSDPTDLIGVTVGGNSYGWFAWNGLGADLAFDNSYKSSGVADSDGDGVPDDEDHCPDSDLRPYVNVGSGPTSINNAGIGADEHGCTIQDYVNECAEHARNHGQYVSCITKLANDLYQDGVITKNQRQEMKTGAAKSNIGK